MNQTQQSITVDISTATTIQGWMSEVELGWLAGSAYFRKNIVEIGSWSGRSTRAMADNTAGRIFAVDNWRARLEVSDPGPKRPYGFMLPTFMMNMQAHMGKFVVPVIMDSLDAAELLAPYRFDMIFIDASHEYEDVKADILAWRPLAAPICLFCGHDYSDSFPGVKRAVDELVPNRQIVPNGTIWWELTDERLSDTQQR